MWRHLKRRTVRSDLRKADNIAKADGDLFELLGGNLVAGLQLLSDFLRYHLI